MSMGLSQPVSAVFEGSFLRITDGEFEVTLQDGTATITIFTPSVYAGVYELQVSLLESGPAALMDPEVQGTAEVGQSLSVVPAIWAYEVEQNPPFVTRQWQADGVDIAGAVSASLNVTADLEGATITCIETATGGNGTRQVVSNGLQVAVSNLIDVTAVPTYLDGHADQGAIANGRRLTQLDGTGGKFTWQTETLEVGKTYRLQAIVTLDAPNVTLGRVKLSDNVELDFNVETTLLNTLIRSVWGTGPNQLDETFTNDHVTGPFYLGFSLNQGDGAGAVVDVTDASLMEV